MNTGLSKVTRRDLLQGIGGALAVSAAGGVALAKPAPAAPVAVARCREYGWEFEQALKQTVDQIGGIRQLVKGKTVAVKLNLTGNPARFPERLDLPYRTPPDTVLVLANLLAANGARRIRFIESFFPASNEPEMWARYGLNLSAINNCGCKVEWENTNYAGPAKKYVRIKVPHGGYIFPAFELNHSYADCDTYVTLPKLKNHWIAGVTMALKNNFGVTPCSLYGGDAYPDGNENPTQERGKVCHNGDAKPALGAPQEKDPSTPREPGYRVPRVTVDLAGARPIDLSIVDGIVSIRGGEGAWNKGVQMIKPDVLLVGKNPVCVDAVCMAVMGYDPQAERGTKPFVRGDNTLKLAEAVGIGTTDLDRIDVRGLSIQEALYDFGPGPIGETIKLPVA